MTDTLNAHGKNYVTPYYWTRITMDSVSCSEVENLRGKVSKVQPKLDIR